MDILPEDISPDVIEVARSNPKIREIIELYLHEVPIREGKPLTWRQALEMMVLKLASQYGGALEGWKDQAEKTMLAVSKSSVPLLVNETEVLPPVSSDKAQLEISKGMLAKMISPARKEWLKKGGDASAFPPIQLQRSFVEQVDALLDGNIEKYIQKNECEKCGHHAWFIQDRERKCAVCEAKSGNLKLQFQRDQLGILASELAYVVSLREEGTSDIPEGIVDRMKRLADSAK